MSVHIYPLDDTHPHTLNSTCWCEPVKDRNGYLMHHPEKEDDAQIQWTFEITDTDDN